MADRISFGLFDATGAPLTGVVPTFVKYVDLLGNARSQPVISELGGGQYGFSPTDADEEAQVAYLIDCGAGVEPRRYSGAIHTPAAPFVVWHLEDGDAALWAGAAPTVGLYDDFSGNARVAPSVLTPGATTYLFAIVPSASDLALDVAFRLDSPANAYPAYVTGSLEQPTGPSITPSTGVGPEEIVVQALLEYWRRYLPAKVTELNTLRASVLKSALVEPFTVPVGARLRLSSVSQEATPVQVILPTGSVTAQAVADAINATPVPGLTASADDAGRLVLTASAPATGSPSVVVIARDLGTDGNEAFGWSEGGEHVQTAAMVSPNWRGVVDGRPMTAPDMGQGFWVFLGTRTTRPTRPGARWHEHNVSIQAEVWRPFSANAPPHRTREPISCCVRACRELILTTDGRYLGRQGAGDIQFADVGESTIAADPISLQEVPGALFDFARFTVNVRVFKRPEQEP